MHPARATQRPVTAKPTWTERVGAGLALVTLAGTIVALLAGAVLNWAGVLLAVAGAVVGVTAGWYAVSRRGAVRGIALAVAAVAVGLFVWGLFAADFQWLNVTLTVALALTSVGCARVALRRTRTAQHTSGHVLAAPPAQHPVLIMNLRSGGGKAERFRLEDECRARGIEPVVLRPGDDLLQLAEDAVARGADVIGMAGGDGSQALVASVAARHQIPHVVVPAGTRNHFALDLGLDRDDVVGALDAFADGVERRIDLAEVNGRVFVNNASLGLYAKIVQEPEYRDAKLKTAAGVLPGLLGPDARPLDLRFTGPDGTGYPTAHLILVSNDPYQLDQIGGPGYQGQAGHRQAGCGRGAGHRAGPGPPVGGPAGRGAGPRSAPAARSISASTARRWSWTRRWSLPRCRVRCGSGCPGTRPCHRPRPRCTSPPGPPWPNWPRSRPGAAAGPASRQAFWI